MKTGARFLSLLLAVLMIAGAAFTVSASNFKDVPDNYTYRDAIDVLARLGVIGGYEDGSFKPDNNVERDEMAKLVFVLKTTFADAGVGTSEFTDTNGNWANGFISYCFAEGIIGGHGDGTYRPDDFVTYDQALKMVCAALGYKDFDSNKWPTDVRLIGIKQLGLNKGLPATLNGSDYLTRGQVAQIFYNALFVDMNEKQTVGTKEVTMQLARDVWNFRSYVGEVLGTENLYIAGAATGEADQITLGNFVDNETKEAKTELDRTYYLEALGLDAYIDNTDALVGRNVKIFEFDGEIIESSALVSGSVEYNVELGLVKNGTKDDLTKITVAGTKYDLADIMAYVENGAVIKDYTSNKIASDEAAYGKFPLDGNGNFIADADVPDVLKAIYSDSISNTKATANVAIDGDGDGVYDYLFILEIAPYTLDSISSVKVDGEKTDKYSFTSALTMGGQSVSVEAYAKDLVTDLVLEEEDVVLLYTFGNKVYTDETIEPISTYVTRNTKSSIKLYGEEEDFWVNAGVTSAFIGFDATADISGVGQEATEGNYYIYNNRIFMVTGTQADNTGLTNTAILRGTEGVTDWELAPQENKYYQFYPAILFENGMEKKVNVNMFNGYAIGDAEFEEEYNNFLMSLSVANEIKYIDELVAYTVDEEGYYSIYTYDYFSQMDYDTEKEQFISAWDDTYTMQYLEDADIYKITGEGGDTYLFDIDESTVMYYYNYDGELDFVQGADAFTKEIHNVFLSDGMKLKAMENSNVYILSSVMVPEISAASKSNVTKFDQHMIFYGENAIIRVGEDNNTPHYSYIWHDVMTGAGSSGPSRLPVNGGGVAMKTGYIAVYRNDDTIERIRPSLDFEAPDQSKYLFATTVNHIDVANNIIFTDMHPAGLSVSGSAFTALDLDTGSAQLRGATAVDLTTMAAAFDACTEEEAEFKIIFAYDPELESVVYVIYGRQSGGDYKSMPNVINAARS